MIASDDGRAGNPGGSGRAAPLAQALSQRRPARVAVLHVDDVGMCHGANVAFLRLFRAGRVSCGSMMVPCPWFPEIAAAAAEDPALDLGVHLTLTSEWPHYRWGPISTTSRASGLVDDQGCFPHNCLILRRRLVPDAAEAEMRAQVDRALALGIDVTHLDAHMGAALVPELVDAYLRMGRDYRLPVLLPRSFAAYTGVLRMGPIDRDAYDARVREVADAGLPVFDDFRMTPGVPSAEAPAAYRRMLGTLPEGATYVALHCNAPGDIEAIVPPRAHWRTDEFRLFGSGEPAQWLREAGVEVAGMRAVRDLWRAALAAAAP